jgi:Fur family ferric uptake transcriptional regulator
MRRTKQRAALLEELQQLHSHPSADELYDRVRRRLPHVSLGTVYRNLELLAREGTIRRLELGGAQMRFDGNLESHQHIRCMGCGRIDDLPGGAEISAIDRDIEEDTGYRILEKRVEFIGICPQCAKAGRDEGSRDAR